WRRERSVRHSFESSTAARARLPWYSCNLFSKRVKSESASAVLPANPARILSLKRRRIFFALCLTTPSPSVTCPSPASTTWPSLRTHNTVVLRIRGPFCFIGIPRLYPEACFATKRGDTVGSGLVSDCDSSDLRLGVPGV